MRVRQFQLRHRGYLPLWTVVVLAALFVIAVSIWTSRGMYSQTLGGQRTIVLCGVVAADERADFVLADFEGPTYNGWIATGDAFGSAPARGTLPNQQNVDGFLGNALVNSYLGGDQATGTLTSPSFPIERDYISFLLGGGNHPGKTCINLRIGGTTAESATGGDAEHLDWETWDVRRWKGAAATIQIVDDETGRWGHVNVDQIIQTDHPPVPPDQNVPLYHERYRPQFHFTPANNWMNDPNGLVFYAGEYHLFFQRNPFGMASGNLTWGHAVSPDLVHWQQLDDALRPDSLGLEYSGSAVVDWDNTSGFGREGKPAMVAMYTAAGGTSSLSQGKPFTQCIAYSNDNGRTWAKYSSNPVIPNVGAGNRDPHVFWYAPTKRWVVIIYKADGTDVFALFDSPDLKHWTHLQDLHVQGCSECPDLFPLPVDGDAAHTKWIITPADGRYLVGSFDGHQFTPEQDLRQVDFGRNFYAVQTYTDAPSARRIQIAWMRDGAWPRMPFCGQMSFPAELTLHSSPDGPRLFRTPVKEIALLHGAQTQLSDTTLQPGENPLANVSGELFHLLLDIQPGSASEIGLRIRGQTIRYSVAGQRLDALGTAAVALDNGHLRLEVLVDRTSIETFVNGGRVSMTSTFLPTSSGAPLALYASGGTAKIVSMQLFALDSAWPPIQGGKKETFKGER